MNENETEERDAKENAQFSQRYGMASDEFSQEYGTASDEEVAEFSRMILERNKVAYRELAK